MVVEEEEVDPIIEEKDEVADVCHSTKRQYNAIIITSWDIIHTNVLIPKKPIMLVLMRMRK